MVDEIERVRRFGNGGDGNERMGSVLKTNNEGNEGR